MLVGPAHRVAVEGPGVGVSTARAWRTPLGEVPLDVDTSRALVADGIAVGAAGAVTAPLCRALVDELVTVDDDAIEEAINLLLDIEKVVVEGAGAAGLAALLDPHAPVRRRLEGRTPPQHG